MTIFIREKDDYIFQFECLSVSYRGDCLEVLLHNGRFSVFPIDDIFGFQINGKDDSL